jgi:hypothetical protein
VLLFNARETSVRTVAPKHGYRAYATDPQLAYGWKGEAPETRDFVLYSKDPTAKRG